MAMGRSTVLGLLFTAAAAALVPARSALAQAPPPMAGDAEPPLPDDPNMAPSPADLAPPPSDALPPPQVPGPARFEQSLSPYGRWVATPEYGRVWMPSGVAPGWQPYSDGRWVFTDAGWSFSTGEPWGWATYHYGRWGFRADMGWYWVPGYVWSPAWVSWRTSAGYVCWSPLAPAGFVYPRVWPGWVAVQSGHMTLALRGRLVPRATVVVAVRGARPGWTYAPMALRPDYRRKYHAYWRGRPHEGRHHEEHRRY
jgi:hypothetical protein